MGPFWGLSQDMGRPWSLKLKQLVNVERILTFGNNLIILEPIFHWGSKGKKFIIKMV